MFLGAKKLLQWLLFFLISNVLILQGSFAAAAATAEGSSLGRDASVTLRVPHGTNKSSTFDHMHEIIRLSGPVSHMGPSVGIPVGEALDPPLCPPPPLTRSLGICYLKKCSNHLDCEKGEACCFNGCIHSCIRPMDRPAGVESFSYSENKAFDWVEDTERILPILELDIDEPASHFVPIPMHSQTPQYEEALSGGELVHLPGGCFISASRYDELKEFMKAPSIKACRCNEGEVVCDVRNERS